MEGSDIKYNGDPLQDFTTMRFLDRFVFRNPKKTDLKSGSSVFNKRNQYRAKGIKSLAPDSKEYLSKDLEQIPIGNVQFLIDFMTVLYTRWRFDNYTQDQEMNFTLT